MRTDYDVFETLLSLLGISSSYTDIFGKRHEASLSAKGAIVKAMVGDISLLNTSEILARLLDGRARRGLEPVYVFEIGQPIKIHIILRPEYASYRVRWKLMTEDGMSYDGEQYLSPLSAPDVMCPDGYGIYDFDLSCQAGLGYHDLKIVIGDAAFDTVVVVTPPVCHLPATNRRFWGIGSQLYAQRGKQNWGMGDLSDLNSLMEFAGKLGAGFIGINPICNLFYSRPEHISPYSPSSRYFFHYLYLDIPSMPEFSECAIARDMVHSDGFQSHLKALRGFEFIDYSGVAALKKQILDVLYDHFLRHHLQANTALSQEFRAFQADGGEKLHAFGVFEALNEHFRSLDNNLWGWPVWPAPFRDQNSREVAQFAQEHLQCVGFFQYLQWHLHRQLKKLKEKAADLSLELGLYFDLPVGVDGAGFDVWYQPELYALDISIGAPPDEFNPRGQNWGLPPMLPHRLRELAYRPFVELLRANMRHASILRIDHVMGLMRLFWIPKGMDAQDGVYVRYPMRELMGIVALESQRNQCVIVGEDLGTVPDEFRQAMSERGMLSYRIFYFERKDGHFIAPQEFPVHALTTVTSHDLPTLRGYWEGRDIDLKNMLDLFPSQMLRLRQIGDRKLAKEEIKAILGIKNDGFTMELVYSLYGHLAKSPSLLLLVQMDDLMGQLDQVNLPGTVQEYPNWRRRLPYSIEALVDFISGVMEGRRR